MTYGLLDIAMHFGIFFHIVFPFKKLYLYDDEFQRVYLFTMAMADSAARAPRRGNSDMEDVLSEGSDICDTEEHSSRDEEDYDDIFNDPEYLPPSQPLDRAQWMRDMFSDSDSDSDDDQAFRGFHDER